MAIQSLRNRSEREKEGVILFLTALRVHHFFFLSLSSPFLTSLSMSFASFLAPSSTFFASFLSVFLTPNDRPSHVTSHSGIDFGFATSRTQQFITPVLP
jgi:hypothetical protein